MDKYSVSFLSSGGIPCVNVVEAPSKEIALDYFKYVANPDVWGYTHITVGPLKHSVKPGQPVHIVTEDYLVDYCIELHEKTKELGNVEIIDADTILADMCESKIISDNEKYQDVGISILRMYRESADKPGFRDLFELLTDVIFTEYLETVAINTTRKVDNENG